MLKQLFYSILLCSIVFFVSCKSQEVTFRKVYEKEMPESASATASIKSDGSYIIGFEEQPKGFGTPSAFVIDGEGGDTKWVKKKKELSPNKGQYETSFWSWPNNILLVFTNTGFNNNPGVSVLDITTGDVLYSFDAENYGGDWEERVIMLHSQGIFCLSTDAGLYAFDMRSGKEVWSRPELTGGLWDKDYDVDMSYQYFDESSQFFFAHNEDLYAIDPKTGQNIWEIKGADMGSLDNADLFLEEDLALFYGPENESLGNDIAKSVLRQNSTANAVMNAAESGLVKDDIIFVDLKRGELMNRSEFYTTGDHYPIIHNDKLVMMGMVLNVYDKNTGERIWQNIDQDRFSSESGLKALGLLTGIDLTIGDRSKQDDLIFDNHIYAFYPEVLENSMKQNKISLRKYDINTGEEIWKTEVEKLNVNYYLGAEGKLFVMGTTTGFIPKSLILAFDAGTGEKLYEIEDKATDVAKVIPTSGRLYMQLYPWDLKAFNIVDGKEISLDVPARNPFRIRLYGNDLLVNYGIFTNKSYFASHNPADFSVNHIMEIPKSFRNYDYRGNTFFMYDLETDEGSRGIIAIDLERWSLKGYLLNKQSGTFTTTSGGKTENEVYKDYHLFLMPDGKYIYELDDDVIKKFVVE
ncbi:PQQ-binding-like beta-propeller repeat protein [Marivirga tractuosa]|uniref:outer membrane protein assembly factor BamB family protein n=1 Tax=Marivirga tractuosa TaxID=1006 RepID=UPI0035D10A20